MSAQPLSGSYRVPGTEPVVAEEDTQAADDERINQMIASAISSERRRNLEQQLTRRTGEPVPKEATTWDIKQALYDPTHPLNQPLD
jgi:hypothetical protein